MPGRIVPLVAVLLGALVAAGALAPGRPGPAAARQASPGAAATPCPATTEEENAAIVRRRYDEVLSGHNLAVVDELHAEDYAFHPSSGGTAVAGDEAEAARLAELLADFPDLRATIEAIVAEGDLVAVRWAATGTHRGEHLGVAATGRRVTMAGMAFHRVACGQIAETWSIRDAPDLLRQLTGGAATPAAATPAA